jgi:hypothetical protein
VKESDIKSTIALLIKEYGKSNIADMNVIKDEA